MDTLFPFGLPYPTAFYLMLYVLTFALHQAFMHYVLAGSLYVAWATLFPGRAPVPRTEQPLAATLRDWMPFLLSAAITAGVAPLLFIQIVYQRHFYTANLLLWWRWMIVVPVLIAAFYLLYLLKSSLLAKWPYTARAAVALVTAGCFVFVGFCWTANHLLSLHEADWPQVYATGELPLVASAVVLRMLVWLGGSFSTMAVLVGWQLLFRPRTKLDPDAADEVRTLTGLACGGLTLALTAGALILLQSDETTRRLVLGSFALPYVLLTVGGVIVLFIGWTLPWRAGRWSRLDLTIASAGCVVSLLGVSVVREALRVRAIDLSRLAERHAAATHVGGFAVFVVSTVLVTGLIVACIRIVGRGGTEKVSDLE